MEGRKEGRNDLDRSPSTTRPNLSVSLLAKFLNTSPWATFTIALSLKNLLKNQIFGKTHATLSFH